MSKQKIFWLEVLKFLAALMITNSHYKLQYPEGLQALGTLGAPGNALFFFVSGYALCISQCKENFAVWYQRRLKRLWVSPLIYYTIISPLVLGTIITLNEVWFGGDLWFVKCIAVYYVLFYALRHYNMMKVGMWVGITVSVVYFFLMPVTPHSIYINDFHYICFFSIMMMGGLQAEANCDSEKNGCLKWGFITFASLVLFYALQYVGKGHEGWQYYFQITSLAPLHSFIYGLYNLVRMRDVIRLFDNKLTRPVVRVFAALTLEIYIVGFYYAYICNFNHLFPLNLIIVTAVLLLTAYVLKVLSNILLQFLSEPCINFKQCFKLY